MCFHTFGKSIFSEIFCQSLEGTEKHRTHLFQKVRIKSCLFRVQEMRFLHIHDMPDPRVLGLVKNIFMTTSYDLKLFWEHAKRKKWWANCFYT